MTVRGERDCNSILLISLNSVIGYEKGAFFAKRAYAEGWSVLDQAEAMMAISHSKLETLPGPVLLTENVDSG